MYGLWFLGKTNRAYTFLMERKICAFVKQRSVHSIVSQVFPGRYQKLLDPGNVSVQMNEKRRIRLVETGV